MDGKNRENTFKRVFRRAGRNKKRASERIQVKLAQELSKARKQGEAALDKFFAEVGDRYPEYAYEPNTPPAPVPAQAQTQAKQEIKVYPPPAPSSSENVSFNKLVPFSSNSSSVSSPSLLTKATPPAVRLNAKPAPVTTTASTETSKEKTPDPVAPVSTASKVEKTLVRTTLAQGDCLFSSIYRAAAERGILPMFANCFGIATDTEMKFIKGIRDTMADSVLKDGLLKGKDRFGNPVDTYDQLKELVEGTEYQTKEQQTIAKGAMYALAAQSFPGWFVSEFGRRGEKMGTKQEFTKKYAAGVRAMGNWTGELEVNLLNHLLATKGCKIQLDATRTRPTELFRTMNGKEVITVYNPSMGHFEYFSFELDDKKALGKEAYPVKIPVKKVGVSATSAAAGKATATALDCKAVAEACQKNLLSPGIMQDLQREVAFLKANGIVKGGGTRRKMKPGKKTRKL